MTRSVGAQALMGVIACIVVGAFFYVPSLYRPHDPDEKALYLYRKGVRVLYEHQFSKAEGLLQQLVEFAPDEPEAWLVLAMAQLNQAENGVDRAMESLDRSNALRANDARVHYCRGIILEFLEDLDGSRREFEIALQLAPNSPDAHYQYGKSLVRSRQREQALPHFEAAVTGNPALAAAWYQLGFIYRRLGRIDDSKRAQEVFKALEETGRGRPRGLVFTELGELAEPDSGWLPEAMKSARAKREPSFAAPVRLENTAAPFAFVDRELDGTVELWASGPKGQAWDLSGTPAPTMELPPLNGVHSDRDEGSTEVGDRAFSFAVGDFTVDGVPDLVVGGAHAVQTYLGTPDGFVARQRFEGFTDAAVRLIDLDLEGDLDLLITDAVTEPKLAVNKHAFGEAGPALTFRDPSESPLTGLEPRSRLMVARDFDRDGDAECVFGNDSLKYLVDNGPQWDFDVMPSRRDVPLDADQRAIAAADLDGDGWDDLIAVGSTRTGIWWGAGAGAFEPDPAYAALFTNRGALHVVDINADGRLDLLTGNALGSSALLNLGGRRFEPAAARLPAALGFASADVDGDTDLDLVVRPVKGPLQFVRNMTIDHETEEPHALTLYLGGERDAQDRRTNLHGVGARVDILGPDGRQTRTFDGGLSVGVGGSDAQGLQPIIVPTGHRTKVETVLIHWPDGVVQSEGPLETDRLHVIDEVQRKESSCPVLFTWDGERYRFITDFMGGGGLGFWVGPDQYGPPDPTETVRIEGSALAPIDGHYRLAILEPMEEIAYIDALRLVAYDHPPEYELYPFELFATSATVEPTGEPVAIRTAARSFPVTARDSAGMDCRDALLTVDRRYAAPSTLDPTLVGYTPRHAVELRFEEVPVGDLHLFLDGWVEYPYSRINFAASHREDRLEPPTFSWRTRSDQPWRKLYREVGYPAGMPKTMVLPLGNTVSEAGPTDGGLEFRIETNMEIYWDRIFLAPRESIALEEQPLATRRALLRFGGYPREFSDDGALPPTYHYELRDAHIPYERMSGGVTRYGDVGSLIDSADDRFAIVAGGDELWLEAEATPIAAGRVRTFFLETHGFCKDLDTLTAEGETIHPLPFTGMSNYPPPTTEVAPDRSAYDAEFNVRRW